MVEIDCLILLEIISREKEAAEKKYFESLIESGIFVMFATVSSQAAKTFTCYSKC